MANFISFQFTHEGHKLELTKNLPYGAPCCNCGKYAKNRLENHTTGAMVYLCDECLADTFED